MSRRPIWFLPLECDLRQPVGPLVYRLYDTAGALLYVGKTSTYARYRIQKHLHHTPWGPQVESFSLEHCLSDVDALTAEVDAIRNERPLHNIRSAVA